tara:strand:- start:493 stop:1482 length:990 start_codon:yes stop_codon:yes gene_type:complete
MKNKTISTDKCEEQTYSCSKCDYITSDKSNYKRHLLSEKHKKNDQSEQKKFNCKKCDYTTSVRCNWDRHLQSQKHQVVLVSKCFQNGQKTINQDHNSKIKGQDNYFYCKECSKKYKNRSGLWKHINSKHIKNEIVSSQPQIINNYNNITNIDKSTNNITNNINISLNVFLKDYCKDALNLEDFMKNVHFKLQDVLQGHHFVDNCVSVKLINDLKDIPVTQRPIHCTDQKRKNFVVKDKEEGWIKEKGGESGKLKKEIDKLYDKAYIEFYHAYDDAHPYPHNSVQEDLKQQTSYKLNQKKDKHKIVGSVARSVDVKDAIDDVINEKIDIK